RNDPPIARRPNLKAFDLVTLHIRRSVHLFTCGAGGFASYCFWFVPPGLPLNRACRSALCSRGRTNSTGWLAKRNLRIGNHCRLVIGLRQLEKRWSVPATNISLSRSITGSNRLR